MKRRQAEIAVSDHAVLRWLERSQGFDIDAIKAMIAGKVINGAQLGAAAVSIDNVKFILVDQPGQDGVVVVTTVLLAAHRTRNRGGSNNG